jgi:glycosidase
MSRDYARTPMQWSSDPSAGFTDGDPWFSPNENYDEINVEAARATDESVWQYYRRLIELRYEEDVLVYGDYDHFLPDHEQLYVYTRTLDEESVVVVLNWSPERDARPERRRHGGE